MVDVYVSKVASEMDELDRKVVFITNRGGTHPNRLMYFDSIGADYQYVDFKLRWHGIPSPKWKMLLSGLICAFSFPKKNKYNLFITSDPQLPAVLMKVFFLLRKDQKIASYLGSQTLYFIYSGYYSRFTTYFYKFLLSRYDYHICNGNIQKTLLQKIINVSDSRIKVNFNGIRPDRYNELKKVKYDPSNIELLFVGNLYSDWRIHYKGIDLLLSAFVAIKESNQLYKLTIIGDYDKSLTDMIIKIVPEHLRNDVNIVGNSSDLATYFERALVYVHPSRGDALPNSLIEALFSGIPAITSNLTGNFEIVKSIDNKLVCDINTESLAGSLLHFIELTEKKKLEYSEMSRLSCLKLTSESAIKEFKSIVDQISKN